MHLELKIFKLILSLRFFREQIIHQILSSKQLKARKFALPYLFTICIYTLVIWIGKYSTRFYFANINTGAGWLMKSISQWLICTAFIVRYTEFDEWECIDLHE